MKSWLSAAEIAELALPGLPRTRENLARLAEREGWSRFAQFARPRAGRGGGMEYHIQLFPVEARVAYLRAHTAFDHSEAAAAMQAAPEPAGLSSRAALERDARIAVLGAFRAFQRLGDLRSTTAIIYFVDLYNLGRIDTPSWVTTIIPRLSTRTLASWISAIGQGDVDRLGVDRGAARRGKGLLDTACDGRLRTYALALVAHNPKYTGTHIHEALQAKFGTTLDIGGKQVPMPGLRAVEMALKRWKAEHKTGLLALTNPDRFVSTTRYAGSYEHLATGLNSIWQIDASPVDALCVDGRHSIYICVDVWSRRIILSISRTPRSEAVQLLIRKAILAWGVPQVIKTDNGSDFVARATKRLFAALNIEAETSVAFSPWQKGVVERHVRTFQTDCGRTLPGFIGHNVADRKEIESRKSFAARLGTDDAKAFCVEMTAAQLQADVDRWATSLYQMRKHGGIGMTPFARASSWTGTIARPDAAALNVLLMQAPGGDGLRTVGKNGIRLDGHHYLCPGLLVGDKVLVRMDPADMGRVYCFDITGERWLGEATCPELAGVDKAALIAEVQAAQKKLIAASNAGLRAEMKGINKRTVLDARFALADARNGNLVAFPQRETAHTSPALDAAALLIAERRTGPVPAPVDPATERANAALMAEVEADLAAGPSAPVERGNVRRLRQGPTPQQLYRRAQGIEAARERGDKVPDADLIWLGGYRETPGFKSLDKLFTEFGEAALR